MEADWSVEIGAGQPIIDGSWEGFIDLHRFPHLIDTVQETQHPMLSTALQAINAERSPLFTTKCDAWTLTAGDIDPDEFGANSSDVRAGYASYIDLVERDMEHFESFAFHEQRMKDITARLRSLPLDRGRVDIVLRAATFQGQAGYGFSLYAAGCGAVESEAYAAWQSVLGAAVAATIAAAAAYPPCAGE
jgi:hypothetical protein